MPDGLTHLLAGYVSLRHRGARLTIFLIGTLLPDLLLRGGRLFFVSYIEKDFLEMYLVPFHTPITCILLCLMISQIFQSGVRKTAFLFLAGGCLFHFLLDFFQCTINGFGLKLQPVGGYHWFFPLTYFDVQFGIVWPEDSMYVLIVLIPLSVYFYFRKN